MARVGARLAAKEAIPTTGLYKGGETTITALSTLAPLPATNLSYRKGITIQNLDATNAIYFWISLPELVVDEAAHDRWRQTAADTMFRTKYNVRWLLSGSGTNEWYAVASTGSGTPSMTEPKILYSATLGGGTETLRTNGTVGSLAAANDWDWGDNDTLGYNTLYVRTSGSTPAYNPGIVYDYIMTYTTIPTTSTGYQLAKGAAYYLELDGSVRIHAIASTGTINVATIEHV